MDDAYYNLRSAIELSTTMVFFADMPPEKQEKYRNAWEAQQKFPMQSEMLKKLTDSGEVFKDIRQKLPSFFYEAKELSNSLNKYVHKQGWENLYVWRSSRPYTQNQVNKLVEAFVKHLKGCIRVLAILRLAIDPFPILLLDDEIRYRCFDVITNPYSERFVKKYIDDCTLNAYKTTDIYQAYYNFFIKQEKKSEATFEVMQNQYVDLERIDEILQQAHLLSVYDIIAVLLFVACNKIVQIYLMGGLLRYFSNRKRPEHKRMFSMPEEKKYKLVESKTNQPYDQTFITVFNFKDKEYFVEHTEMLSEREYRDIQEFVQRNS